MTTVGNIFINDGAEDEYLETHYNQHPDFGCLFPGECCMPALHFESECHIPPNAEIHRAGASPAPVQSLVGRQSEDE